MERTEYNDDDDAMDVEVIDGNGDIVREKKTLSNEEEEKSKKNILITEKREFLAKRKQAYKNEYAMARDMMYIKLYNSS